MLPVSVVVPVFNNERTIERALASVRAQTRQPAEIIIVDDGSSDRSAELARAAGARIITQANAGAGAARNAGILGARQPWIALLDADDEWKPGKLEAQFRALEAMPDARLVCSNFDMLENGLSRPWFEHHAAYRALPSRKVAKGVVYADGPVAAKQIAAGNFMLPSTVVFGRELVSLRGELWLGVRDLVTTPYCRETEDSEWYLRLLRWTGLLVVEEPFAIYHRHGDNVSLNTGRERYGDVMLGRRIAKEPQRYAAGIVPVFEGVRSAKLREAAVEFVRRGQIDFARRALADARRTGATPLNTLLLWAVTLIDHHLGRSMIEGGRTVWKRALKPLIGRG